MAACGGIADLTLTAARRSPDFEVTAIQDVDEAALNKTGDRYDIRRRHLRFEDLLTEDIDFVVVNSPNHVHLDQVRAAAAAGKPCLVQKPLARNLAEAEAMVALAAANGIRLGVTMFEISKPLHHQVKAMVREGWLGTPTVIQACSAHDIYLRNPPEAGNWRRDPDKVGGGAFIQLAVHQINLASWILEKDVTSVSATGTRGQTVFEDETTLVTTQFRDGPVAHFAASYAADLYAFSLCGTRGRIHLFPDHLLVKGDRPFAGEIFDYPDPGEETVLRLEGLQDAVEALRDSVEIHASFARWLLDREAFPCPGEIALRDMKVVDAAYRSMKEGMCIHIS